MRESWQVCVGSSYHKKPLIFVNRYMVERNQWKPLLNRNVKLSKRERELRLWEELWEEGDSHPGSSIAELKNNTHQLLQSYGRIVERAEYLLQINQVYSSALVQNEILDIQAKITTRQLADKLQKSGWYFIMVDETYEERASCHLL